jgi:nitroimidazol reductase NimA-like FMN-containing flavoprotein (pyridoxamine 5'-phosphate oxidase superfamily)
METQTWLLDLPRQTCEELLRGAVVGRLAVVVDGKPEIFPVCHIYEGGCVMFPTNEGTKLHAALAWPYVGFEVDGLEVEETAVGGIRGWSVMVTGRAELVTDTDEINGAAPLRRIRWRSSGSSLRWVRVVASTITGRRIDAVSMPVPARHS